jgi:hypothetical protein
MPMAVLDREVLDSPIGVIGRLPGVSPRAVPGLLVPGVLLENPIGVIGRLLVPGSRL